LRYPLDAFNSVGATDPATVIYSLLTQPQQ
jgi:hypothetical protein